MVIYTPTIRTHHALLSDGTNTIGLTAVLDKSGLPIMSQKTSETLSAQQYTTLGEDSYLAEQGRAATIKNNQAGFGKITQSPFRYFESFNVDASKRERIEPSPVIVATTHTPASYSAPSIINGDMEAATGWTLGADWAYAAGAAHGGSQGLQNTSANWTAVSQNLGTLTDRPLYVGLVLTYTIWARYNNVGYTTPYFEINDASGGNLNRTIITLTASWVQYSVAYTVLDTIPTGNIAFKFIGNYCDIDDAAPSLTITTSTAPNTITKIIDFNSAEYAVSNSGVWKRTADNWARVAGSPPNITDAFISADGVYLVLCCGLSLLYWYMDTAEVFYRNTGSGKIQYGIAAAGANYANTSAIVAKRITDIPTFSVVAITGNMGQSSNAVTSIVNHLEQPWILKTNWRGYISTTDTIVPVVGPFGNLVNANTGKQSLSWNSKLYTPAGTNSLLEYDDMDIGNISPAKYDEIGTNFRGMVVALAGDDEWLYVVQDNGAKIEILKGREFDVPGAEIVTDWHWHPFIEDTYATCAGAVVSSLSTKQLIWWGGTALPKYVSLAGGSYASGGTFVTSWLDLNLPQDSKTWPIFALDTEGLSVGHQTIKVEYHVWGEGASTWHEVGDTGNGTFSVSPRQVKSHIGGTIASVNSVKIQYRYTFTTDSATAPFAILTASPYPIVNPARLFTFSLKCRVANDNKKLSGDIDTYMTYNLVMPQLKTWVSTNPLTLTWFDGTTYTVKFAPAGGFPIITPESMGHAGQVTLSPAAIVDLVLIQLRTS